MDLTKLHLKEDEILDEIHLYSEAKQAILNCWSLLKPKPRTQSAYVSTRLRNEELIENQEELINSIREILEPFVIKIRLDGDNGSCDDTGDIAETENTTEIETTEESEPTNGGTTKDD